MALTFAAVLATVSVATVWSACHHLDGPAGDFDCFVSSYYGNQPQWGTCVTDVYLTQKSKGRYKCRDQRRTYCYYQCMLEMHDQASGTVTPDCACDVNNTVTTQRPDVTLLPSACFSPDGTDCGWYQTCLEAKFQCAGGPDDYGITYGEAFCRLYEDSNIGTTVSPLALEWLDNVRKCLLVELVPLLRAFDSHTCSDVKERAFTSHTQCYIAPFRDAPSLCQLSLQDFWRIFWVIRVGFKSDFVESVLGFMEVRQECSRLDVRQLDSEMRKLMVTLKLPFPERRKRSARGYDTASHDLQGQRQTAKDYHGLPFRRNMFSTHRENVASRSPQSDLSLNGQPAKTATLQEPQQRHQERERYAEPFSGNSNERSYQRKIRRVNHRGYAGHLPRTDAHRRSHGPHKREVMTTPGEDSQPPPSADWPGELFYHETAGKVCRELAEELRWDDERVLWFAYGVHRGGDRIQVHILLAGKALGVLASSSAGSMSTTASFESDAVNLTAAVEQARSAFQNGDVSISIDVGGGGGKRDLLYPGTLSSCEDLSCAELSFNVTAPRPRLVRDSTNAAAVSVSRSTLIWFTTACVVLVWKAIFFLLVSAIGVY